LTADRCFRTPPANHAWRTSTFLPGKTPNPRQADPSSWRTSPARFRRLLTVLLAESDSRRPPADLVESPKQLRRWTKKRRRVLTDTRWPMAALSAEGVTGHSPVAAPATTPIRST